MNESDLGYLNKAYSRLYGGLIYDAMRHELEVTASFVLDQSIRPLWTRPGQSPLFGVAFTCRGKRVLDTASIDDSVRLRMFRDFTDGCVEVIATDGDRSCAHFGDISGRIARRFGCRGAVVDGNVRDAKLIESDQFPVFCSGVQPIDAFGRWQIVDYQVEICLPGIDGLVRVTPGDYVFADADGVLIIPPGIINEVCIIATRGLEREDRIRANINNYEDIEQLHGDLGRW
jgi:4-hydroxy-4-methyl-2-oxoglutarate aldolase